MLVGDLLGVEFRLELLVENLLKDVLEPAVIDLRMVFLVDRYTE